MLLACCPHCQGGRAPPWRAQAAGRAAGVPGGRQARGHNRWGRVPWLRPRARTAWGVARKRGGERASQNPRQVEGREPSALEPASQPKPLLALKRDALPATGGQRIERQGAQTGVDGFALMCPGRTLTTGLRLPLSSSPASPNSPMPPSQLKREAGGCVKVQGRPGATADTGSAGLTGRRRRLPGARRRAQAIQDQAAAAAPAPQLHLPTSRSALLPRTVLCCCSLSRNHGSAAAGAGFPRTHNRRRSPLDPRLARCGPPPPTATANKHSAARQPGSAPGRGAAA